MEIRLEELARKIGAVAGMRRRVANVD